MSPAAMAVMQHDKQIKNDNITKDINASNDDIPQQDGGLLTHLLAKAGKATRRSNTTKTVNMNQQRSGLRQRRDKGKSRVIRRTIIYVPPDSLNFMKHLNGSLSSPDSNIPMPPLPQDMIDKIRQVDQRRPSKNSNMTSTQQQENGDGGYYDDTSLYDYYQGDDNSEMNDTPQLQGLEVREMDDGTVEWGIVKKQGNRKSFYAHDNTVEHSRDEEDGSHGIEEHLREWMKLNAQQVPSSQQQHHHDTGSSLSPPPIPRRSPRRRIDSGEDHRRAKHISTITSSKDASTIDVYFAPQQTLPSLLQMIADSTKEQELAKEREKLELERMKQASVEDQLDEVMRSFQHTE